MQNQCTTTPSAIEMIAAIQPGGMHSFFASCELPGVMLACNENGAWLIILRCPIYTCNYRNAPPVCLLATYIDSLGQS